MQHKYKFRVIYSKNSNLKIPVVIFTLSQIIIELFN